MKVIHFYESDVFHIMKSNRRPLCGSNSAYYDGRVIPRKEKDPQRCRRPTYSPEQVEKWLNRPIINLSKLSEGIRLCKKCKNKIGNYFLTKEEWELP